MNDETGELYKVVLLGASMVGKSSLLLRVMRNEWHEHFQTTIGVDFYTHEFVLPSTNQSVKLQLWDTAGQEKYKAVSRVYYKGLQGVVLVYAIDDIESFFALERYMNEVKVYATDPDKIAVLLLGNKSDLQTRAVPQLEIDAFVKKQTIPNILVYETSAKTGENVKKAFEEMAMLIAKEPLNENKAELPVLCDLEAEPKIQTNDCGC
eukprot:CAMPEP_0174253388 /NCGR_PEP_ID=MMETSP0439-20130205/2757_1 /TAXON_ID=0 /ORGANISM="Stereomyxa ramosa, Strain Chinc5" /LENGTH=206 /DNA_ID=CAMNT_0015334387 /DNA_START=144 /DNA_END=764 /DNA_ORIENTATION=+